MSASTSGLVICMVMGGTSHRMVLFPYHHAPTLPHIAPRRQFSQTKRPCMSAYRKAPNGLLKPSVHWAAWTSSIHRGATNPPLGIHAARSPGRAARSVPRHHHHPAASNASVFSGYDRKRGVMEKNTKTITDVSSSEPSAPEHARPQAPRLREMSLARAKKLIQKTSEQHDGLFRRLAK